MKSKKSRKRKCSALLAAGAGAAVCLSGGAGHATIQSGTITGSNTKATFIRGTIKIFGSQASFYMNSSFYSMGISGFFPAWIDAGGYLGTAKFPRAGTNVMDLAGDVDLPGALNFQDDGVLKSSVSNKYLGVRFNASGTKYGWLVYSTGAVGSGHDLALSSWGYQDDGGSIKTLSDSVSTHKLALSGSSTKLHWTNDNEDGVARYEVQTQDASGEWQAIDSDTPGEGVYAAKVDSDAQCRLVVEKVDGTTEEVKF